MSEIAIKSLPSVVQCINSSLLRDEGCVDGKVIRDLGWALYTFAKDEELCRLLLLVLEMLIEYSEDCVFGYCEEYVDSIIPVLCRFLSSKSKDCKTLSLSLLNTLALNAPLRARGVAVQCRAGGGANAGGGGPR